MRHLYLADRLLVQRNYVSELHAMFGDAFNQLDETARGALGVVYRHNRYGKVRHVSAKQAAFSLWYERSGPVGDIQGFDTFYRKVRNTFNKVEKGGFVVKADGIRGYALCEDFRATHLL